MRNLFPRRRFCAVAGLAVVFYSTVSSTAENVRYKPISRDVVEARLRRYTGDNKQREATLKQNVCRSRVRRPSHSEQPVKGSKVPNVMRILPGSTDKVIIVGATSLRARRRWGCRQRSGASLLPSLYEAITIEPRKHTQFPSGLLTRSRAKLGLVSTRAK